MGTHWTLSQVPLQSPVWADHGAADAAAVPNAGMALVKTEPQPISEVRPAMLVEHLQLRGLQAVAVGKGTPR